MEQKRRADVVRKIAGHAQSIAERREVERQRIRFVQRESIGIESIAQTCRKITVDLDRGDAPRALEQRAGERAESRPDLDNVVAGSWIDRVDDSRDVMRIDEKVLAEPLARPVTLDQSGARRASAIASSMAATRLPGSAVFASSASDARSSAVPWSTDVRMNGKPSVTLTPCPKLDAFSTGNPWS